MLRHQVHKWIINHANTPKNSSSGVAPCSIVSSFSRCEDADPAALIRFPFDPYLTACA